MSELIEDLSDCGAAQIILLLDTPYGHSIISEIREHYGSDTILAYAASINSSSSEFTDYWTRARLQDRCVDDLFKVIFSTSIECTTSKCCIACSRLRRIGGSTAESHRSARRYSARRVIEGWTNGIWTSTVVATACRLTNSSDREDGELRRADHCDMNADTLEQLSDHMNSKLNEQMAKYT